MKNNIIFFKKKQREEYRKIREELNKKNVFKFDKKIIDNFFNNLKLNNLNVISSFFSIKTEIPTNDLNRYLEKKNKKIVFPVVKINTKILSFRLFEKNKNLIEGKFGIPEPSDKNEELLPDLLFVPCLAFDENGNRIGYGGGFYDSTFEYFKSINHKFLSIGYAYDNQKTYKIVIDKNDYKLDYVLTEKQLYTFL